MTETLKHLLHDQAETVDFDTPAAAATIFSVGTAVVVTSSTSLSRCSC